MSRILLELESSRVFALNRAGELRWVWLRGDGKLEIRSRVVARVEGGHLVPTDTRSALRHTIARLDVQERVSLARWEAAA